MSMQDLESEVQRLCQSNRVSASLTSIFVRFQGKFGDAHAQKKHDLSVLPTQFDDDWDMLRAVVHDRTREQLILDAEQRKCRNV